jgi:hypothetical protein
VPRYQRGMRGRIIRCTAFWKSYARKMDPLVGTLLSTSDRQWSIDGTFPRHAK